MKRLLVLVLLALSTPGLSGDQAATAQATTPSVRYGANTTAGRTFAHDGVTLYYEVYGAGEPLLLVHGNGGSIGGLTNFPRVTNLISCAGSDRSL